MAENSKIEWTDHTFNPWMGCTKISPACDHCYAEGWAKRSGIVKWGNEPRRRSTPANWAKPLKWNSQPFFECRDCGWRGHAAADANGLAVCPVVTCANCLLTPARPRVFCASLADVFDNQVDPDWRVQLFNLIQNTPNLDWLLLTKRIGNAATMIDEAMHGQDIGHAIDFAAWPWPNVWIGATIANQEEADRDIPKLLATPARVRFLSMEPLLGPVDISRWLDPTGVHCIDACPDTKYVDEKDVETVVANGAVEPLCPYCGLQATWTGYDDGIDWVITGGESGPKARPSHPDWFRSLRDQCAAASVTFLFKQWGEWREPLDGEKYDTTMGRAATPPAFIIARDGTVRCFQDERTDNPKVVTRVGKKNAGRLLDGRTWDQYPEVRS